MFWALEPSDSVPATAVFMPTTSPALSRSGPPELPGLIAASVWIMLSRVSLAAVVPAVTVRPSAETIPEVTVGVPAARPSALPMATTASPTTRPLELPKVTVGRFETPWTLMSATSSIGLVPTSTAGMLFVEPVRVTVIVPLCTAAAMT